MNDAQSGETSEPSVPPEILVLAVTDGDTAADPEAVAFEAASPDADAATLAGAPDDGAPLSLDPAALSTTLADLQTELAGTARTGIPSVDAALDRLADLDPDDLAGSADILADVLRRLEGAMEETPEG